MNKPWLVPAIVFLALLLLWPLRWDKGPLQNNKVRHLHDRWTGDDWVYKYSTYGVEVTPSWSSNTNFTILSPSAIVNCKKWETKMTEAIVNINTIKSSSEFKEYNSTMNALMNSYREQINQKALKEAERLVASGQSRRYPSGMLIEDQIMLEAFVCKRILTEEELFSYAWNNLPNNLRTVGKSALEAEGKASEAARMVAQIKQDSSLIVLDPYDRRNLATGFWVLLVVASGVKALKSYRRKPVERGSDRSG